MISITHAGHEDRLEAAIELPRPREDVFPFFADALNLEAITPPWLRFLVLTPAPIPMHAGTHIEYRLRLHGVPLRWLTEIAAWEPPHRFVDRQLSGPYALWEHEHRFREVSGGTVMSDQVTYRIRGGRLADRLGDAAVARRDLLRIFEFRGSVLRERFG